MNEQTSWRTPLVILVAGGIILTLTALTVGLLYAVSGK